jgi:hypothetical protein
VNSWVSGGFLPAKVRGTKYEGLATGWDWYHLRDISIMIGNLDWLRFAYVSRCRY